jgi:hypothetical protein
MNTPSSIRLENGFEPRRLWSLWDMMQLHAGPFLDAVTRLAKWVNFWDGCALKGKLQKSP